MKKIRVIMMTLAVVVAVGGAFTSNAYEKMVVQKYGQVPDDDPSTPGNQPACRLGDLIGADNCSTAGSQNCQVSIDGIARPAFVEPSISTPSMCTSQLKRN